MARSSVRCPSRRQTGSDRHRLSSGRVSEPSTGSGTGASRLPGTLRCRRRLGAHRTTQHGQHGGTPLCKPAAPPHPRQEGDVWEFVTFSQHWSGPGGCNCVYGCGGV